MVEKVMDIKAIPSYLMATLRVSKVKVCETDNTITIFPINEREPDKKVKSPFLGIAVDSTLTVEKFLEWKHEEREAEGVVS
jgi:hypothetical protein